ncbi:MAG: hypothetical protein QW275_02745, partial [Candidatus Anstonellaceae archaeon]
LFGCIGNDDLKKKYEALQEEYNAQKEVCEQDLKIEKMKNFECRSQIMDCNNAKKAVEDVLASKNQECLQLANDASVLNKAREKIIIIEKYRNLTELYYDTYGPGKIINSAKLNRMENYIRMLNDTELQLKWNDLRKCGSISECESAKSQLIKAINQSIEAKALEVVEIIK